MVLPVHTLRPELPNDWKFGIGALFTEFLGLLCCLHSPSKSPHQDCTKLWQYRQIHSVRGELERSPHLSASSPDCVTGHGALREPCSEHSEISTDGFYAHNWRPETCLRARRLTSRQGIVLYPGILQVLHGLTDHGAKRRKTRTNLLLSRYGPHSSCSVF